MNNKAIQNGLLAGVVAILVYLIIYFISDLAFVKYASWIGIVVIVGFMIKAAQEERKSNDQILTYSRALGITFLTYVVASLMTSIFTYVMYNFIDVSLLDALRDIQVETLQNMEGLMGEEATSLAIDELYENGMSMGLGKILLGWLSSLLVGFIIALIVSAFVKRNPPIQNIV